MTEYFFGFWITGLLVPIRVALSVLATVHIILHKRDPGAAIGWIGAVWLMPFLGVALYYTFGINRVRRLAQKLVGKRAWSGHSRPRAISSNIDGYFGILANAVGKLSGRALQNGNRVKIFYNGDQAYPAMLDAIAHAHKTITLCTYIIRNDKIGNHFADALITAHQRGVKVYVIVDGVGSGYIRSPIVKKLRKNGIRAVRFLNFALPWGMSFINLRTHRKILIADGKIGFMGGVNIADENVLRLKSRHPVADTHFSLEGPVVEQLMEAFVHDWFFTTQELLAGDDFFPPLSDQGESLARIVTSGPDTDVGKIEFTMMEALSVAQKSIWIMTPYFLPDDRFITVLAMAALRGVDVNIIIPARSNHLLLDWATAANSTLLLSSGCRIWKGNPPFNHSKLMMVDNMWSFVGSANLDVRSLRLNFEINMECYDQNLAEEIGQFIARHRNVRVTHYDLDKRPWLQKLRDATVRLMLPYL